MNKTTQKNLFYGSLMDILDINDPLIILAQKIAWSKYEIEFEKYYSKEGRPAKPIRLMVGLLLLKHIENLSDDNLVVQWKRNPYYQYFCGFNEYQPALPCDASDLSYFRKRIGKEGFEYIFKTTVTIHGELAKESQVIIDSTVQESNITYPTDGKLAIKIINHLHKIAKAENIKLRRTYLKEIKGHRISLRFYRHPKKIKKARGAMKRLKTIAKTLIRDIDRKFEENMELHNRYAQSFYLFMKILLQTKKSKNKIYSLHEVDAYAINKGKDHKRYEYGTKASIVTTKTSGIIVGVEAHKENIHDSKTLKSVLTQTLGNVGEGIIKEAICDRGYRGTKAVEINENNTIEISIPGVQLKRDTQEHIKIKREKFKRRAAIEPIIGHLKSDHRMQKNYLKGFIGDEINLLLAASAFNLKKWMNLYFWALFSEDYSLSLIVFEKVEESFAQFWFFLAYSRTFKV